MSEDLSQEELASRLYDALAPTRAVKRMKLRRVTYRCRNKARCLLLDAIETPKGIVLHQPRYKLSPARNELESNEAGRLAHTIDGANHWRSSTYFLDQSALSQRDDPRATLGVQCDHVAYPLRPAEFWAAWEMTAAEVALPPSA